MTAQVVLVAMIVALAGCSLTREAEIVKMSPTLSCQKQVRCHIYGWFVGLRIVGGSVEGTHINCRCAEADAKD